MVALNKTGPPVTEVEARTCHCCPCCAEVARFRLRALHPEEGLVIVEIGECTFSSLGRITPYPLFRSLRPNERRLLTVLALTYPQPCSRQELHDELFSETASLRGIDTHVSRIRAKLKPYGIAVHNLKHYGYALEPTDQVETEEGDVS